jgi:prevent-host-death family protein
VKAVTTHELRWELTQIAQDVVAGKRVVVTFRGKPKFALVPLADLEQLEGKPVAPKPTKRKPK